MTCYVCGRELDEMSVPVDNGIDSETGYKDHVELCELCAEEREKGVLSNV